MTRLITLAVSITLVACASQPAALDEDFTDLAGIDAKSDAFSAKLRLLGSIQTNVTISSLPYTHEPPYRGLAFVANRGDVIRVDVRSSDGGDAVAWVLDSEFRTLAKNDDADASTSDAAIAMVMPPAASPIHYIVWKDITEQEATFAVTFASTARDAPACAVVVSPPSGPQSAEFALILTSRNAVACRLEFDGDVQPDDNVSCNVTFPQITGSVFGVGTHSYTMHARSAAGVVTQCSTLFTITP